MKELSKLEKLLITNIILQVAFGVFNIAITILK